MYKFVNAELWQWYDNDCSSILPTLLIGFYFNALMAFDVDGQ